MGQMALDASILSFVALVIFIAGVFSLPFPFVRRVWQEEYWGLYGIFNSVCFMLIAQRLKRMSMAAVFAGFGMILYELLLTARGFSFLYFHHAVAKKSVAFLGLSLFLDVVLTAVLASAFKGIVTFRQFKQTHQESEEEFHESSTGRLKSPFLFVASGFFYLLFLAVGYRVTALETYAAFATLRMLGIIASILSTFSLGYEVGAFLKDKTLGRFRLFKMLFHGIFFVWLLWMIHSILPLEQMITSNVSAFQTQRVPLDLLEGRA